MPTIVKCPNCATGLSVPDHILGKTVRCPRCREAVRAAAAAVPVADAVAPPPAAVMEQPAAEAFRFDKEDDAVMARRPEARRPEPVPSARAERSRWDDDDDDYEPRRRKKKKKKSRREGMSYDQMRWLIGGILAVVGIGVGIWLLVLLFRRPAPATIPDERWETVEVPNRLRVRLPGPSQRVTQAAAGVQMVMYMCQPDRDSAFGVGYMEGALPPHRAQLPPNVLLDDACNGSVANMPGAREVSREPLKLGEFPGKQVVADVPQGKGQMIIRGYLAHGRLFIVMAGGKGFRPGQPNVQKMFDSFEILDKGQAGAPPAPQGPPGGPQAPPGGPLGPGGPKGPPLFNEPKAPEAAAPNPKELFSQGPVQYLADAQEMNVRHGPWKFSKDGTVGGPPIRVNNMAPAKSLGMHPPDMGFAGAEYQLNGKAAFFKATVALNDTAEAIQDAAIFEVLGDGKRLWASEPIRKPKELQNCNVDVRGVQVLALRVQAPGSHFGLHAVWLEPRLLRDADTPDPADRK